MLARPFLSLMICSCASVVHWGGVSRCDRLASERSRDYTTMDEGQDCSSLLNMSVTVTSLCFLEAWCLVVSAASIHMSFLLCGPCGGNTPHTSSFSKYPIYTNILLSFPSESLLCKPAPGSGCVVPSWMKVLDHGWSPGLFCHKVCLGKLVSLFLGHLPAFS